LRSAACCLVAIASAAACSAARTGQRDTTSSVAIEPTASINIVTPLRVVRDSAAFVGRTITVRGRCLEISAIRAQGPPPRARSDWQIDDGDVALFVVGPRPADCPVAEGSRANLMVTARVAEDTVPLRIGGVPQARRFLLLPAP